MLSCSALLARQWIQVSASVHGALGWNFSCYSTWKCTLGDFVSSTGNVVIPTLAHMKKIMTKATVRDVGHLDNAIDLACLEDLEGM